VHVWCTGRSEERILAPMHQRHATTSRHSGSSDVGAHVLIIYLPACRQLTRAARWSKDNRGGNGVVHQKSVLYFYIPVVARVIVSWRPSLAQGRRQVIHLCIEVFNVPCMCCGNKRVAAPPHPAMPQVHSCCSLPFIPWPNWTTYPQAQIDTYEPSALLTASPSLPCLPPTRGPDFTRTYHLWS
jgi:hypothetical protein